MGIGQERPQVPLKEQILPCKTELLQVWIHQSTMDKHFDFFQTAGG